MHVGHLLGALANWTDLQAKYRCFFMIADWHALTTHYEDPSEIRKYTVENVACMLAAGIDPARSTLFRQSDVPEHAELHLLLSMVTPVPWLERVPSYKEQKEQLSDRDLSSYGFLGYPVLQAADILAYKATLVPVGDDQVAHLELAREIVRRFNNLYGNVLHEPEPMLTKTPRLPGPDRRKMSKSYGNPIEIGHSQVEIDKKIMQMFTDPRKIHLGDKGHPEECVVFAFHEAFNPDGVEEVDRGCRDGSRGCVDCKNGLKGPMWEKLRAVHDSREKYFNDKDRIEAILAEGAEKAREVAGATLDEVRSAMKLS